MIYLYGARRPRRKVIVPPSNVAWFNRGWPGSPLNPSRSYYFEFDKDMNLIDTDVPEESDGDAAMAVCDDCLLFLTDGILPAWSKL